MIIPEGKRAIAAVPVFSIFDRSPGFPLNVGILYNLDMIRQSLREITSDLNSALFDSRLVYPVYVCVPSTGALLTIACPRDPDDAEWVTIIEIAREIVERTIGVGDRTRARGAAERTPRPTTPLVARPIPCAWAGATMAGAEIVG